MASFLYFSLGEDLANNNVDLGADTFYAMLVSSSYTPNQAHSKRSDITNEVSGTGYTAGGEEIAVEVSRTNGVTSITFDPVTWPAPVGPGFTPVRAIVYKSRGGAASADELVACLHDASPQAADGNSYTLSPSGPLTITIPTGV